MNAFMFVLSGDHGTLPGAELEAVLGGLTEFSLMARERNFAVCKTKRSGGRFLRELGKRLSMTHSVFRFVGCVGEGKISNILSSLPGIKMPYRVRVHLYEDKERTETLEREIGGKIWRFLKKSGKNPSVSMREPETSIEFFFSAGYIYCGIRALDVEKEHFGFARATRRPYFRPVSMDPRIARAMVNLSRSVKGRLLDPFCGTGGILIEAGKVGMKVYGMDSDAEMVEGTIRNLGHFGIRGTINQGDAREMEKHFGRGFIDCIVTCPPCGRLSCVIGKNGIQELYNSSIFEMERTVKKGGHVVIASPTNINIKTNMQLIEIHKEKLNRSMERKIMVFRKDKE